jgi:hypothetical protein
MSTCNFMYKVKPMVASRILMGRGVGKERRMVRKCSVSLMQEGRNWTIDWRWDSINADSHSMEE